MSTFQTILLIVFGFILVIGVLMFAGVLPGFRSPAGGVGGAVEWWGTVPQATMEPLLADFNNAYKSEFSLRYQYHDPARLEAELVEALALGEGPDLVTIPHELVLRQAAKLAPWPEESLSRRAFADTFIRGGDLFMGATGALALPLYVDPLVMYVNQDLLTSVRLPRAPATWEELREAISRGLVKVDAAGNIVQTALPLGAFGNIAHAKEILATLVMQAGATPVVREPGGVIRASLNDLLGYAMPPAAQAVEFFNRFSDPANEFYTWNSALPEARDMFAGAGAAFYLGFASELPRLRLQNPQLVFDATTIPQRDGATANSTFGRLYGVAVLAQSRNSLTAYRVAGLLASPEFAAGLATRLGLPPARIDLLSARGPVAANALAEAFYESAIIARGWLDPDPVATAGILRRLAETTKSGQLQPDEAVRQANEALAALLGPPR